MAFVTVLPLNTFFCSLRVLSSSTNKTGNHNIVESHVKHPTNYPNPNLFFNNEIVESQNRITYFFRHYSYIICLCTCKWTVNCVTNVVWYFQVVLIPWYLQNFIHIYSLCKHLVILRYSFQIIDRKSEINRILFSPFLKNIP